MFTGTPHLEDPVVIQSQALRTPPAVTISVMQRVRYSWVVWTGRLKQPYERLILAG